MSDAQPKDESVFSFEEAVKKVEEEWQKQHQSLLDNKPTILLVGRAGTGKSSLINYVFGRKIAQTGVGRSVTEHYNYYADDKTFVNLYDSKGWEEGADGENEFMQDTRKFLQATPADQSIDIVWYTVDAPGARFTDFDQRLIQNSFTNLPVIIVLTKCDIARPDQITDLENLIHAQNMPNLAGVVRVSAAPIRQRSGKAPKPYGIEDLTHLTMEILPEARRASFAAQTVDLSLKDELARNYIVGTVTGSFFVGVTPIPFADAPILAGLQIAMVMKIQSIYNTKVHMKENIASFIVGNLAASFGKSVARQVFKFVPGMSVVNGTVAATITAAMGFGFRQLFHQIAILEAQGKMDVVDDQWIQDQMSTILAIIWEELKDKGKDFIKSYDNLS